MHRDFQSASSLLGSALAMLLACPADALTPENLLLLYNSREPQSQAIRDAYLASRPGIQTLDLNSTDLVRGSLTRAEYLTLVREPVVRYINGVADGIDRSRQIMCLVTTRGLPARIISPGGTGDEFQLFSSWASMESELALLQQDLEALGTPSLPRRHNGLVLNPYWMSAASPIASFDRSSVKTPRAFSAVSLGGSTAHAWTVPALTPGDIYLVCRLDSAATPGGASALDNVRALIERSRAPLIDRCAVQALLDEYAIVTNGFDLDDGAVTPIIPDRADFENTAAFLASFAVPTTNDHTFNFVTGPELANPSRPLVLLGTYGENHAINNWGENPPGVGTYVQTYAFHPAAIFIAYESWGGTSLYTGAEGRGGQQQALDFIAQGGSYTIASVMEPYAFTVPDLQDFVPNFWLHSMTFAEAAASATPAFSWQWTAVGDPLSRVTIVGPGPAPARQDVGCHGDSDRDGIVSFADISESLSRWSEGCATGSSTGDADDDGAVTFSDITEILGVFGIVCGPAGRR